MNFFYNHTIIYNNYQYVIQYKTRKSFSYEKVKPKKNPVNWPLIRIIFPNLFQPSLDNPLHSANFAFV